MQLTELMIVDEVERFHELFFRLTWETNDDIRRDCTVRQDFLQTRDPFSEFRHRILAAHPAKDRIGCRLDRNVQVTNDDW